MQNQPTGNHGLGCGQIYLGPSLRSNNGLLASVSCLSGGYNLDWFSDVLG